MNQRIIRLLLLASLIAVSGLESLRADFTTISSATVRAGVYVKGPATLIVDDWDDGVLPNNLGGGGGTFASENEYKIPTASATSYITVEAALGGNGCGLKINYDLFASSSYCGYWTRFHPVTSRDLSRYKNLSFYVKGATGGEFFKVQLSQKDGMPSYVYVNDFSSGPITTEWRKVTIPFDAFANIQDWTKINELTFVFEARTSQQNGSSFSGRIYIDMITIGSEEQALLKLDSFSDRIGINCTGGGVGDTEGGWGAMISTYTPLTYVSPPYSVRMAYLQTWSRYAWGAFYSIIGGGLDSWTESDHDLSAYDRISFWVRAESASRNPERMQIEIRDKFYTSTATISGIDTVWKQYTLPFTNFTSTVGTHPDPSSIRKWTFTLKQELCADTSGALYIDDVQFLRSGYNPDTTPPSTPYSFMLMDSASGRQLAGGDEISWMNWLRVRADSGIQDPTIERVQFEYRIAGQWVTISADYDVSDGYYNAYWDTSDFPDNQLCDIRAVAYDVSGNASFPIFVSGVRIKHLPDISSMSDEQLQELLEKQIFWYFWSEANPNKGLIQDRAKNFAQDNYGYTSVASAGYGLSAICIAHQRGWLSFNDAYKRTIDTLKTYFNAVSTSAPTSSSLTTYKGFYYHWTDFGGVRCSTSTELSTIDTSLFVAGALFAGQYFKDLGYGVPWDFAEQIYSRIDWKWMTNNDPKGYLKWGWTPEGGFNQGTMSSYSECLLSYILAAGAPDPEKRLDAAGWNNLGRGTISYRGLTYPFEKSLFTYQYPSLFVDFSGLSDGISNPAANLYAATIHHQRYAYDNRGVYTTYNGNSWGLGATDIPAGGYKAYGIGDHDGTVAFSNLFAAIGQRPKEVMQAYRYLYNTHKESIWGKYGFCDSYNTDPSISPYFNTSGMWRGTDILGVQQGAVLLAMENYRSNLVQDKFASVEYVQDAFARLNIIPDTSGPGVITGISAQCAASSALISWTAPGDNGYSSSISTGIYEIRFTTNSEDTWDNAPGNYLNYNIIWSTQAVIPGSRQSRIITNILNNTTYYFWIRMTDKAFQWSPVSERIASYSPSENVPPAQINTLTAEPLNTTIRLHWETTGDDGPNGILLSGSGFAIGYSSYTTAFTYSAAQVHIPVYNITPGTEFTYEVTGLLQNTTYYFRVWTHDEVPNWSGTSNITSARMDTMPPSAVTSLAAQFDYVNNRVSLAWSQPGDDGLSGSLAAGSRYRIQYSTWAGIVWSTVTAQIANDVSGNPGELKNHYIPNLPISTTYYFKIWYGDEAGNWSSASNMSSAKIIGWSLWEDCDSRFWWGENWGGGTGCFAPHMSWGNFHGRQCMRANWDESIAYSGLIRSDWVFLPENWESVTGIKMDVRGETVWPNGLGIRLEPKPPTFDPSKELIQISNLTTGVWHTITFNFTQSLDYSNISALTMFVDGLGNKPASVYIDNIRLVTTEGDVEWDDMDDQSRNWLYDGCFYNWNTSYAAKEEITHMVTSSASPAGALYLRWSDTVVFSSAVVRSGGDLNANWNGYRSISADIYCSNTNAAIKLELKDGTNILKSSENNVSVANTWQTLYWNLPAGSFDWSSVNSIGFVIDNTNTATAGQVYIDNIKFGDAPLNQ